MGTDPAGAVLPFAEHGRGDELRQGMLAGATGAGEEVKVGHAPLAPGGAQVFLELLIAEQGFKAHISPSSGVDYPLL